MGTSWSSPRELSDREAMVAKLCKKRPLYVFLRLHRHLIFDEEIVSSLHAMYAGVGRPPEDPVRLAMAMLLQVAFGEADSEVPTLTATELRWRMVLDLLDASEQPAFSQGTVFNFRQRAIEHGFAKALLDKTVQIARDTKGFGHKRLRAVFDSSPLLGAGRVEDTINIIGHAIGNLVKVAAAEAGRDAEDLANELVLTVASGSSVKAALDVDWRKPEARNDALNTLIAQFRRLERWLEEQFSAEQRETPPLSDSVATVLRLIEQDTEPDPDAPQPDRHRIRQNQTTDGKRDRQISLADPDMRNGRKSSTKLFAGYKRHVAADADVPGLVTAVALLPANLREHEGADPLLEALDENEWTLDELHADRGYLPSGAINDRRQAGLTFVSKPPAPPRSDRFTKYDFAIDFEARTATCPGGQTTHITNSNYARFQREPCAACPLSSQCLPESGVRQLHLHANEQFFREMADELATPEGRALRRQRTVVEHALAHVGAIQGNRARYLGKDKNLFDLERAAAVNNLYVLNRLLEAAA